MDYIYAQLNEDDICMAISYLAGDVAADNLIRIDGTKNVMGMRYNKDTGEFIEPAQPESTSSGEQPDENTGRAGAGLGEGFETE